MQIKMIWATYEQDPLATPELVEAWDEYTIDNNPQGFDDALANAWSEAYVKEVRVVTTRINEDNLREFFGSGSVTSGPLVEDPQ